MIILILVTACYRNKHLRTSVLCFHQRVACIIDSMKYAQFLVCENILKSCEQTDLDGSSGTVRINLRILIIIQVANVKQ
jgi:hypothetical protein